MPLSVEKLQFANYLALHVDVLGRDLSLFRLGVSPAELQSILGRLYSELTAYQEKKRIGLWGGTNSCYLHLLEIVNSAVAPERRLHVKRSRILGALNGDTSSGIFDLFNPYQEAHALLDHLPHYAMPSFASSQLQRGKSASFWGAHTAELVSYLRAAKALNFAVDNCTLSNRVAQLSLSQFLLNLRLRNFSKIEKWGETLMRLCPLAESKMLILAGSLSKILPLHTNERMGLMVRLNKAWSSKKQVE
jgi:hypothetical protein